jgi:hypothetical protein
MKTLLISFLVLPISLFAHSGHPGPAAHGDFTHLLVGTAVALPIALIVVHFGLLRRRKKAEVKVSKQD